MIFTSKIVRSVYGVPGVQTCTPFSRPGILTNSLGVAVLVEVSLLSKMRKMAVEG